MKNLRESKDKVRTNKTLWRLFWIYVKYIRIIYVKNLLYQQKLIKNLTLKMPVLVAGDIAQWFSVCLPFMRP
jgi:hypothetical protein